MKFTIEIKCTNAAFGDNHAERLDEIIGILENVVDRLITTGLAVDGEMTLRDSNHDWVGIAKLKNTRA